MCAGQRFSGRGLKGSDTGIDGIIYFKPDGKRIEKAIVEVESGATGVKDVGRLAQVIERDKALIGVLITAMRRLGMQDDTGHCA